MYPYHDQIFGFSSCDRKHQTLPRSLREPKSMQGTETRWSVAGKHENRETWRRVHTHHMPVGDGITGQPGWVHDNLRHYCLDSRVSATLWTWNILMASLLLRYPCLSGCLLKMFSLARILVTRSKTSRASGPDFKLALVLKAPEEVARVLWLTARLDCAYSFWREFLDLSRIWIHLVFCSFCIVYIHVGQATTRFSTLFKFAPQGRPTAWWAQTIRSAVGTAKSTQLTCKSSQHAIRKLFVVDLVVLRIITLSSSM
ncbi:hypothetical protein BC629DRAFT_1434772 [Irpex lacteus]|nr:hypothetical protein BC629DRAFT_1434772 [Irpex lacteus]